MKNSTQIRLLFLSLLVFFFPGQNVYGETMDVISQASFPSLVSATRVGEQITFCNEQVPLESREVRERLEKELLLIIGNRPQVILWLKRSTRYFPYIEKILAQNNMPDDLKYIAVAESALLSHAGSSKGAVGYWQFIPATGRRYGLTVDGNMDERRNFFTSTKAAVRYLQDLYDIFGSWTLATAAYNVGEDHIQEEMTRQEVDSYYDIYLPRETQRYIFKIIAIKQVLSNPSHFGFYLQPDDYYPPLTFDRVRLVLTNSMPVNLVAQAADTHYKHIRDLNPEIRGPNIPKGNHIIAVPKGAGENFHSRFAPLAEKWQKENSMLLYVVKKGDNLSGIAEQFGVDLSALMNWNNLSPDRFIHPGDKLIIYQQGMTVFPKEIK